MKKFWRWENRRIRDQAGEEVEERVLYLDGAIAEESWWGDEVTPKIFREELESGSGDITVWINSPGGDCVAASQIYTMLMDYKGNITVKIDGLAASAASVIAMAGTEVLMAATSLLMIHNPATIAWGDSSEMQRTIDMLESVKDSIINAYEIKTGLPRDEISRMMDEETWMDARKAVDLGFSDGILQRRETAEDKLQGSAPMLYSRAMVTNSLKDKIAEKCKIEVREKPETDRGRPAAELRAELEKIKLYV